MKNVARVKEKLAAGSKKDRNGCWLWQRSKKRNGYGIVCYDGTQHYAHRASHLAYHGPIPDGMYVCHRCDVPSCVNPAHLYAGSPATNQADSRARGRMNKPIGARNPSSKLTVERVRQIRTLLHLTNVELGKTFGIDASVISQIRHGKLWRHA